jgi:hypothetical protein
LLVDPADASAIAGALKTVLTDRGAASHRAAVARERVTVFSEVAAAAAYEKLYEQVLQNRNHIRNGRAL